jgi:hypothetical protein
MRILTLLVLGMTCALSTPAGAADKCKYERHGVDSFTKQMVAETKWKSFRTFGNQVENHGWMAARSEGGKQFLGLKIVVVDHDSAMPERENLHENRVLIPKDAKLLILLADDTILELAASAEARGKSDFRVPDSRKSNPDTYVVRTTAIAWYELTADTRDALLAHGATDIRLSASDRDHDFTFGDKPTDRIQFVLGCIQ